MKILLFTEIYDAGGIETFINNLITAWPSKDDSFILVTNSNYPGLINLKIKLNNRLEFKEHPLKLYNDNYKNKILIFKFTYKILSPVLKYVYIFFNAIKLYFYLKKIDADQLIVINGGYPGGDSCRAALIGWGFLNQKPKAILNFHNLASPLKFYNYIQESVVDYLIARSCRLAITVSMSAKNSMKLRPIIYKNLDIQFVHNGLEIFPEDCIDIDSVKAEFGFKSHHQICLMLSTYEKRKGHDFLFNSFTRVINNNPQARLLICGFATNEEMKHVSSLVKKYNLQGLVYLSGFRTDISRLIQASDLVLIASQEYESFGYTSLEAMAHFVPVIATNVGGIPEVVMNNHGGFVFEPFDTLGYANSIIELLGNNEMRSQQGLRGYKRYLDHFSAKAMAKKYFNLIHFGNSSHSI